MDLNVAVIEKKEENQTRKAGLITGAAGEISIKYE